MAGRIALALFAASRIALAALDGSRYMWFEQPGVWPTFEEGIPIGNGRLAAAVYGGGGEVLGINENSIWTGPFQDRTPANATAYEPTVRDLLLAGNISQGGLLTMADMIPTNNSPRSFSYFGNINITFGHQDSEMEDYIRWLDTKEGVTGVNYTYGGVAYT